MSDQLARQLNFLTLCMLVALALFIIGLGIDVQQATWRLASISDDGTAVTITFEQPPCVWATGPDVTPSATLLDVRVTLRSWAIPCTGPVRTRSATIDLDEPIGGRRLVGCQRPDCAR